MSQGEQGQGGSERPLLWKMGKEGAASLEIRKGKGDGERGRSGALLFNVGKRGKKGTKVEGTGLCIYNEALSLWVRGGERRHIDQKVPATY